MTDEEYVIYNSKLEEALNTSDSKWLDETFTKARKVIADGGRVAVLQRFSDASKELVELIDNMETLEHYQKKYSV